MTSPAVAGMQRAKEMVRGGLPTRGISNDMLRMYFNIDWKYSIDQSDYPGKVPAFQAWKRGFKNF